MEDNNKTIEYFRQMVDGALKVSKPWRIALYAIIAGWTATVLGFCIFLILTR